MDTYKYQMHCHTANSSKCATTTTQELITALYNGGYKGCVLTNHFRHGNTIFDRNLPWNDFVSEYEKDYNQCKKAAKKYDLDIIFGIEEHLLDGLEILCYGITPQFLYDNPQLKNTSPEIWYDALKSFGAVCIQAHPYRDRAYITNPRVLPLDCIDGIEVFNLANPEQENQMADDFALKHSNLILTSGADDHDSKHICCAGIAVKNRIRNEKQLADVLKSKDYTIIK